MRRFFGATMLALVTFTAFPAWLAAGESDDAAALLKSIPADWPMAVVIPNFRRFDDALKALGKRVNPASDEFQVLNELKGEIGVGDAVDFSRPFGMSAEQIGGPGMPVVWAHVPDAANKIKAMAGAKQEDDVWQFGPSEEKQFFAKVQGDLVIVAPSKETLGKATKKENRSLADELKGRADLLNGREVLLHLNFDPIRDSALAGVAQFGQMVPMMGMMMAQQAGGGIDPAMVMGGATTLLQSVKSLVEQFAYIDLAFGVDAESTRLTIATGYKDGPIKTYLGKSKPAGVPLLSEIEEQPYLVAMAYHVPGGDSPLVKYFAEQLKKGMNPSNAPASGDGSAAKSPMEEGLAATAELYSGIEGSNALVSMGAGGMRMTGDYIGSDPSNFLELCKKLLTSTSALTKQLSGGMTFEAAGTTKVGDVTVERFAVKVDPGMAGAEQVKALVGGEGVMYGLGVCNGRVRYCQGDQKDIERAFAAKPAKPLSSSPAAKASLDKLPEKRNGVILLDPAGLIAVIASQMGGAAPAAAANAPPAAISFSVCEHPARVDIYVPIKAIEQVLAAVMPKEPS